MKQNIKKVWLILSMIICLAAVSGCAAASDTDKELDPSVVMTMQQGAQQYLALFSSLTDEQLDQYIIQSEENKDYVMENDKGRIFLEKLKDMMQFLIPNYILEGKNQLVIAIGCTGGKHRSVTLANALYQILEKEENYGVRIEHRDIGKDSITKKK